MLTAGPSGKRPSTRLVGDQQRGPQAVLGGHTYMARRTAEAIARRLGNALVAPVLPFSPAGSHLNPKWPGSVDLPPDLYAKVNEAVVASMVTNGFRNIVLMGDHGGGQEDLKKLAAAQDARYAPRGVHVYFCSSVYREARDDFNAWLKAHNLPVGTHASIPDTSELMYLGGDAFVRPDRLAAGTGENGIVGDSRPASAELGKSKAPKRHLFLITDGENTVGPDATSVWKNLKSKETGQELHLIAFDIQAARFNSIKQLGATVVGAADAKPR